MSSRTYYSDEAERAAKTQQTVQIVMVLFFGLAIGAVVALLYAPKEGKKTRKMLGKELGSSLDSGRDLADDVAKDAVKTLEDQYKALRSEMDKLLSSVKN